MPRKRRANEAFGDGAQVLGTIITNERGHEVYSITGEYLATYTTLGAARKALLKRRPAPPAESE